jgi:ABC-type nitrate/sulfonate/bicarbonate transport system permease component
VAVGSSPRLRATLEPALEFPRAIPPPVLVPIFILVTGMRQALSIGIILMVISEMFAASSGLGFTIVQFQRGFAIPEMRRGILLLAAVGRDAAAGAGAVLLTGRRGPAAGAAAVARGGGGHPGRLTADR